MSIPLPPGWTHARMVKLLAPLQHPDRVPEAQWQKIVHALLDAYGWRRLHIPPVKVGVRWITPGRRGFPDVCAVHPAGVCLVLELKTNAARVTDADQQRWMTLWRGVARRAPGVVEAFVARPSDFNALITHIAFAAPASPQASLFDASPAPQLGL